MVSNIRRILSEKTYLGEVHIIHVLYYIIIVYFADVNY